MVIVLKEGTKKKVTCPECGALLAYDASSDVIKKICNIGISPFAYPSEKEYIICPQCDHEVAVNGSGSFHIGCRKEENQDGNI